ncbi:hypothetical protein [Bartonella sp. CB178]|uniref:hypothetical protein n=1 Tax=Bartonella sp. CB178 TaxID=3112255 RepID=UPI00300DED95
MFIQSFLFFILGVSSVCWLLVLFAPLIWRRATYFAHKFVSAQIPLSAAEMQASYDFLRAKHAVELVQNEQKYSSLQKKYSQQKIQLSQTTEQLYKLCLSTRLASRSRRRKEPGTEKNEQDALATHNFITEVRIMREKIAHYLQRLEKIQTNESGATIDQKTMDELREETKELAATLAAQVALQEGASSPINTLIQSTKRKNDLASRVRRKIARTSKKAIT